MRHEFEKRRQPDRCGTGFRSTVWLNWDCCGLVCAAISWFLVVYAEASSLVPWMGASLLGLLHISVFTLLCFMALVSHGKGTS
ncbi:hypothetical protein SPRG_17835 [Saprolegnia parasitica CBS 223.65]|uniref:Uncharacterized protein n=1 Tax=Saprolegnia parasitica (strain CBS 223.65) TaxID=695850 RepID=A0A067BF04_SAPPC|nr:hypothetical protein SPRG_17835 [Saprolegnia parasitica CBS 223.65]KDO16668.1 hypothetical protein SPRG_17835 [Saprolegnia parasitica CBS 223.65]|eukprot:XP_012212623.1 hypothetical protein SPRG_17835 [Saprolegnia parasitica CBS 223.65]